ncbi:hypothetical protein [Anabaena azotica]|uniref:Uncharacterized protein n=1 Tax=Anabaena azotica FACHB-119 TaxID=947527 RepID=A0ABR8DBR1_9NOST|nr:hypothetical protein [Anabaena azotica]MBD2503168.1 hypothetical protein [Anabaena azotica FACHB-119]
MVTPKNRPWNLNSFLESLIEELDNAHQMLSVKGLNRKLSYMVQDVALDLQLFPEFDGDKVYFTTAKPGETGASKITVKLGSIRDHQILEMAELEYDDGFHIDRVQLPEPTKKELRKLGITSVPDLRETIENRKVKLDPILHNSVDYQQLAAAVNKFYRGQRSPTVAKASLSKAHGKTAITLQGENLADIPQSIQNLATAQSLNQFPFATLDGEKVAVISANAHELKLQVEENQIKGKVQQLKVALDPYAIISINLKI